jgi:NAD(P)-dependent dehydrogenase (short-subunit alcohol dehydrogenase family)
VRLSGKVALVTGGGSGIGRAIALGYAREGARVVAADVDLGAAEQTAALAAAQGGQAAAGGGAREGGGDGRGTVLPLPADVADPASVQALIRNVLDRLGALDVLVNNAAIQLHGQDGPCLEVDESVWERTVAVNLRGPFLCTKYALPALIRSRRGAIVNIASPTAFGARGAGYTAYATSKGGVVTLTRVVAADYAPDGVRCNAIVPGATETPLIESLLRDEATRRRLSALGPIARLGQPEDVVPLAVYLASDESAFATGSLFFVDGGSVMA